MDFDNFQTVTLSSKLFYLTKIHDFSILFSEPSRTAGNNPFVATFKDQPAPIGGDLTKNPFTSSFIPPPSKFRMKNCKQTAVKGTV